MLRFAPHGEYRIVIEDNTLWVEAKGPFNIEIVTNYAADMEQAVKQMGAPWRQLIVLHQNGLFTPEAIKGMHSTISHRKELGLAASAIVIIDASAKFAIEMQVSGVYDQLQVRHQYFDTEQLARQWLFEVVPPAS